MSLSVPSSPSLPASCDRVRCGIVTWRQHDTKLLSSTVVAGLLDSQMTGWGRAGVFVCRCVSVVDEADTHKSKGTQRHYVLQPSCLLEWAGWKCVRVIWGSRSAEDKNEPDNNACPWKLTSPPLLRSSPSLFVAHAHPPSFSSTALILVAAFTTSPVSSNRSFVSYFYFIFSSFALLLLPF